MQVAEAGSFCPLREHPSIPLENRVGNSSLGQELQVVYWWNGALPVRRLYPDERV